MADTVYIGTLDEIPPGTTKVVQHDDEAIAVFNVNGTLYACSNRCPHAAGPLEQGWIENGRIACPWHGWSFPLSPENPPNDGLPRYRVVLDGEAIRVELPAVETESDWK